MPITVTEYVGQAMDNDHDMLYRFVACPWCGKSQGFRFESTTRCSDCNRDIIDAFRMMHNPRYKVAYHRGLLSDAGVWMDRRRF